MKIIVTNDDGVYSPGLWTAVDALQGLGEVVVVAPDREQSGVGSSITLHVPVRATQVDPRIKGITTYAVEGTPADSVILALEHLVPGVGLVISGINQGTNLGEDVLVSGTVGAALQGFVRGVASLAVSVAALQDPHFEVGHQVVRTLSRAIYNGSITSPVLLNVNIPNKLPGEIKGIDITRMGRRSFTEVVQSGEDSRKRPYYWIKRERDSSPKKPTRGTDMWAVKNSRISITPLGADLTHRGNVRAIRAIVDGLTLTISTK